MTYFIKAGFQYSVEADNEEEAKKIAEQRFIESVRSFKDDESLDPIWIEENNEKSIRQRI